MRKYYNTSFAAGKSSFTDVDNQSTKGLANVAVFQSKAANVNTSNGVARMAAGEVSYTQPFLVPGQEGSQGVPLNEFIALRFNVRYGNAAAFTALRAEVNRLLDDAASSHALLSGIVPPVSATFDEA